MMLSLRRNREALEAWGTKTGFRRFFSPAALALDASLRPHLRRYVTGQVLDAGCGHRPYQIMIERLASGYDSLDIEERAGPVTIRADLQRMPEVPSDRYDVVLCSEVLEHLPKPDRAIGELRRVLKPQGTLILTVPFLSRLHEEPCDYFRFTEHGLRRLLADAAFSVEELRPTGSVFGFLGHQISSIVVVGTFGIPLVRLLVFWLNAMLVVFPCYLLDRIPKLGRKLPLGYVLVARKAQQ